MIVTTHSGELIDAFSDTPEFCERDADEGTQCRRLVPAELDEWLERYTLGALWGTGEIGGIRRGFRFESNFEGDDQLRSGFHRFFSDVLNPPPANAGLN